MQRRRDPNKKKEDKRYPYDKGKKQMKQNIVDPESKLIYQGKHWQKLENLNPGLVDKIKKGEAPVTKMIKANVCDGILKISGDFTRVHEDEILNTIQNSGKLAEARNSMNKIEKIDTAGDSIIVYTVKNQLAVTIGKKLDKSFKGGNLEIIWSKEDQPVEVHWHKD